MIYLNKYFFLGLKINYLDSDTMIAQQSTSNVIVDPNE